MIYKIYNYRNEASFVAIKSIHPYLKEGNLRGSSSDRALAMQF